MAIYAQNTSVSRYKMYNKQHSSFTHPTEAIISYININHRSIIDLLYATVCTSLGSCLMNSSYQKVRGSERHVVTLYCGKVCV
jgi:hypothetical protein